MTAWRRHLLAACSQKTCNAEAGGGEWITPKQDTAPRQHFRVLLKKFVSIRRERTLCKEKD